jgi:hypothetical protein
MAGGLAALVINDGKVINQANAAIMFKDGDYRDPSPPPRATVSLRSARRVNAFGKRLLKTARSGLLARPMQPTITGC